MLPRGARPDQASSYLMHQLSHRVVVVDRRCRAAHDGTVAPPVPRGEEPPARPGWSGLEWLRGRPVIRAASILREYTHAVYFPIHGLTTRQRVWVWPRLLLIEYLVYRVDAVAERNRHDDLDRTRTADYARLYRYKDLFVRLLRLLGAWNVVTSQLVEDGESFARLENAFTARSTSRENDVHRLMGLRPTDVRLLHAAMLSMLNRPDDPVLRAALWPVEVLADIANDIEHYEQDRQEGTFNACVVFQELYGDGYEEALRGVVDHHMQQYVTASRSLSAGQRRATDNANKRLLRSRLALLPRLPDGGT